MGDPSSMNMAKAAARKIGKSIKTIKIAKSLFN
jgi:hypothetical protein